MIPQKRRQLNISLWPRFLTLENPPSCLMSMLRGETFRVHKTNSLQLARSSKELFEQSEQYLFVNSGLALPVLRWLVSQDYVINHAGALGNRLPAPANTDGLKLLPELIDWIERHYSGTFYHRGPTEVVDHIANICFSWPEQRIGILCRKADVKAIAKRLWNRNVAALAFVPEKNFYLQPKSLVDETFQFKVVVTTPAGIQQPVTFESSGKIHDYIPSYRNLDFVIIPDAPFLLDRDCYETVEGIEKGRLFAFCGNNYRFKKSGKTRLATLLGFSSFHFKASNEFRRPLRLVNRRLETQPTGNNSFRTLVWQNQARNRQVMTLAKRIFNRDFRDKCFVGLKDYFRQTNSVVLVVADNLDHALQLLKFAKSTPVWAERAPNLEGLSNTDKELLEKAFAKTKEADPAFAIITASRLQQFILRDVDVLVDATSGNGEIFQKLKGLYQLSGSAQRPLFLVNLVDARLFQRLGRDSREKINNLYEYGWATADLSSEEYHYRELLNFRGSTKRQRQKKNRKRIKVEREF